MEKKERNDSIVRMYQGGMTYQAIGLVFNIKKQRVEQIVSFRKLQKRSKRDSAIMRWDRLTKSIEDHA